IVRSPSKRRGLVHKLSKLPIFVNPLPYYQELYWFDVILPSESKSAGTRPKKQFFSFLPAL
ncbi:hypothetical protein PROFUN_08024, partial [Planoprotostelium fungivorum]